MNFSLKLTALVSVAALSACAVLDGDKVDYKSNAKAPPLTVPPDLTQLSKDTRYSVVNGGISAAGSSTMVTQAGKDAVALNAIGDIRVERLGNQRWLVVNRSPASLWSPLKSFWQENGFTLTTDQADVGIMETEWNENRANIPQDFIRRTLGSALDMLYSTSLRDKYRTRLESRPDGGTEIYITHRGMQEVYASDETKRTIWEPRAADPELEAEFLRRLMLKLGATKDQTAQVAAANTTPSTSITSSASGQPELTLVDGFDRAWRRVGLALDRTGFTVEDRDRNKGLYFVRYLPSETKTADDSWFKKLFGSASKSNAASKFQVSVRSMGEKTTVSVLNELGAPELSEVAKTIVKVLADDLK